jgi:anti-sigma-K factor RskA
VRLPRRNDLHTLTGAYAVDALDATERDRFERHLHRCPSCDREVRGLQETATRLAVAVAQAPPPGLKATVLTAAAQTRQHSPARDSRPMPMPRAGWWRPRLAITVAAAASAVIIALGVILGVQHSQLDQARSQQRQAAAALHAVGARVVTERTSLGGTATVVVARRLGQMVFTTSGLPALPATQVYQLWRLGPTGAATSAGLLRLEAGGQVTPVVAAGPPAGDHIAVTVEPAGGTAQPTTTPIVSLAVPG